MAVQKAGVIGTLNYDMTLFVDRIPPPGGESRVFRIERRLGGKGGNTVTALARIIGGARFFGALGRDEAMRAHFEFFRGINVDVKSVRVSDEVGSGVSFVMVDPTGQNTVSSYPGANSYINEEYVRDVSEAISELRVLIATNVTPSVASEAFKLVKGTRIYVPAVQVRINREGVMSVDADYIIVNEEEHRWINGWHGKVIETMGSRGAALFINGEKKLEAPSVDLASVGLKAISTVGAGDTFTGSFGAFIYMGLDEHDALLLANAAAALKVTRDDPRGSPDLNELIGFLKSLKARGGQPEFAGPLSRLRKLAEETLSKGEA